jgi:hypothetical protein
LGDGRWDCRAGVRRLLQNCQTTTRPQQKQSARPSRHSTPT